MAYPRDRFDDLPDDLRRVGAHRTPRKPHRWWVMLLIAALSTLILIVLGLAALKVFFDIGIRVPFTTSSESAAPTPGPTQTPTPTPTAATEPLVDPSTIDPARNIVVSVYNGTAVDELQNTVGDTLAEAGWPIGVRALASTSDVADTTVFYSEPANEDVALGLVAALGLGAAQVVSAEQFPGSPVTIVIGLDYPGATPEG